MKYLNDSYSAESCEDRGLQIAASDGRSVVRLAAYVLEFGHICNLRAPVEEGSDWIVVDSTVGLAPGDSVELRNEYQLGRSNLPLVHECKVIELRSDAVRVDAPPTQEELRSAQGTFLLRRKSVLIGTFAAKAERAADSGATWVLHGTSEVVDVEVTINFRRDSERIETSICRRFHVEACVLGERLIWTDLPPLKEVYRKNRQLDCEKFQRIYNVDREGALFSAGENCS